jgi:hypothetical protein
VVAILSLFVLPDFPTNTKWLSPKEAAVAEWRLVKDAAGETDEDDAAWSSGFKDAFRDWRTYAFAAIFHCVLVLTSVQNFFVRLFHIMISRCGTLVTIANSSRFSKQPTVVKTLGFGRIATLLLTVPPFHWSRLHHLEQLFGRSLTQLILPCYASNDNRNRGVRHWSCEPQHRSTILRHGAHDRRRPRSECCCHRLGCQTHAPF